MSKTKTVTYTSENTYSTLNRLTPHTKNIWFVFHGLGYLSKYFIEYFNELNPEENYIVALQAPSKYYQDLTFKHVGASWLTRVNTEMEIEDILNYIRAVYEREVDKHPAKLFVLGYSQGVSIAARWVARHRIGVHKLILHSGGIPKELKKGDFDFLPEDVPVIYLYGDKDQYVTEARKTEARLQGENLFGHRLIIKVFDGIHEVHRESIKQQASDK